MEKKKTLEYKLNRMGIAEITEFVDSWMKDYKVPSKNRIRSVFMMESMLLDLSEHFGEKKDITVKLYKRLGVYRFKLIYEGEKFNPAKEEEDTGLTHNLISNMGMNPIWRYKDNSNEITFEIPRNKMKDENVLILSVILSIIAGIIKPIVPAKVSQFILNYILLTITESFMNLLGTFAGLMIFFSIISGICGMGSVSNLSKRGKFMIFNTEKHGCIQSIISTLLAIPFFAFKYGKSSGSGGMKEIYDLLMDIVPTNPITPFLEGNMLQVAFIAVLVGIVLILSGSKVQGLVDLTIQGSSLFLNIIELICRLLPIYIFAALTELFWVNGFGVFVKVWKPVLLCLAINVVVATAVLIKSSLKYKISPALYFKKIFPAFLVGLTTASSVAAYGVTLDVSEREFGIDSSYTVFALPLKNMFNVGTFSSGFVITLFYFAEYYQINVNIVWFISVWAVVYLMMPAVPPVSGGTLIVIGIIMNQFGIPKEALAIAATLVLLFDFIMTASKVITIEAEIIEEADHFGLLNKEKLAA